MISHQAIQQVREALAEAKDTLTDPRIGQWSYMEGSEIYEDFRLASERIKAALATLDAALQAKDGAR